MSELLEDMLRYQERQLKNFLKETEDKALFSIGGNVVKLKNPPDLKLHFTRQAITVLEGVINIRMMMIQKKHCNV